MRNNNDNDSSHKETTMKLTDLKQYGIEVAFPFKKRYDNYIGGQWVPPVAGEYFENISPITGEAFCVVPGSGADDIEKALDAAHAVEKQWASTPVAARAKLSSCTTNHIETHHTI